MIFATHSHSHSHNSIFPYLRCALAGSQKEREEQLAGKSLPFSFNIGPNFSFSVDTRGKEVLAPQKKKKTPSTLRRDARRREELLRKKLSAPTTEETFKCDHCDNNFKSENGLKIHIGKSHKKVDSTPATPDCLRQQTDSSVSLSASPLLDTSREESVKMTSSRHPRNLIQPPPMKCVHRDYQLET